MPYRFVLAKSCNPGQAILYRTCGCSPSSQTLSVEGGEGRGRGPEKPGVVPLVGVGDEVPGRVPLQDRPLRPPLAPLPVQPRLPPVRPFGLVPVDGPRPTREVEDVLESVRRPTPTRPVRDGWADGGRSGAREDRGE